MSDTNTIKALLALLAGSSSFDILAVEKAKAISPAESLLPMLMGLVTILAIIFVLAFLFKKFTNFGLNGKNIQVLESQMIGNKEKLMIIQIKQQQFLIGVTGQSISQLGELNQPIEIAATNNSQTVAENSKIQENSFAGVLAKLVKGEYPLFSNTTNRVNSPSNRATQATSR